MSTAVSPAEAERLRAVRALQLLDTAAEERFDSVVQRAQRRFQVPMVAISLIDRDRQWLKARVGIAAQETTREVALCDHAIRQDGPLVVPDARQDERFRDNPLVTGAPYIRFYVGAPLHAPGGQRVGALCLISDRARTISQADLAALRELADWVEGEMVSGAHVHRRLAPTVPDVAALIEEPAYAVGLGSDEVRGAALAAATSGLASVLCRPVHVPAAVGALRGRAGSSCVTVATRLTAPGDSTADPSFDGVLRTAETVLGQGARELVVDATPARLGRTASRQLLEAELAALVQLAHAAGGVVRLALQTSQLSRLQLVSGARMAVDAGVAMVDAGTWDDDDRATMSQVALIRAEVGPLTLLGWNRRMPTLDQLLLARAEGVDRLRADVAPVLAEAIVRSGAEGIRVPLRRVDY